MLKKATVLLALLIACRFAHADLGACFEHAAQRRHLNVNLLLAIGRVESRYRPWEVNSTSGAIGVMQILPSHLKWLSPWAITNVGAAATWKRRVSTGSMIQRAGFFPQHAALICAA